MVHIFVSATFVGRSSFISIKTVFFVCYNRNETKIYWYPVRKFIHYNMYDCCPGWIGYQPKVGCMERKYLLVAATFVIVTVLTELAQF